MNTQAPSRKRLLALTQFAILLALEAVICFTPLGSIPFTPTIVATLMAVPVIVTAILLGTGAGALMGFFSGLFSFLVWTFSPPNPLLAFVFTPAYSVGDVSGNGWSLVICFVPRILVGVVAGLTYRALSRAPRRGPGKDILIYGISGALGSLANTLLVLGGIYLFFGRSYAEALGVGYELLLGMIGLTIATNGLVEAAINAVAAYFVCRPIQKYVLKSNR